MSVEAITKALEEMEAREKAATPGPWLDKDPGKHEDGPAKGWPKGQTICAVAAGPQHRVYAIPEGGVSPWANLKFIASARTDLPKLCAALRVAIADYQNMINKPYCGEGAGWAYADAAKQNLDRIASILGDRAP